MRSSSAAAQDIKSLEERGIGGTAGAELGRVDAPSGVFFDRSQLPDRFRRAPLTAAEIEAGRDRGGHYVCVSRRPGAPGEGGSYIPSQCGRGERLSPSCHEYLGGVLLATPATIRGGLWL